MSAIYYTHHIIYILLAAQVYSHVLTIACKHIGSSNMSRIKIAKLFKNELKQVV